MKNLLILFAFFCVAELATAQHYGGLYFSADYIPNRKNPASVQGDDFFSENTFSWGYTIGYQGLFFQQSRFSFSYGLQYSYRPTYQDNLAGPGCLTGWNPHADFPVRLEEEYRNIEIPLGVRLNILKSSKWQPYLSAGLIPTYLMKRSKRFIYENGNSQTFENGNRRFDASIEAGAGVNYRLKKYLFNLHTSIRHLETQGKLAMGLAVMRNF
jgi:hypothetical protein